MGFSLRVLSLVAITTAILPNTHALAPSDTHRDADLGQNSYVGGGHNIDPTTVSQFKQLWNVTFKPDEKHWAKPLVYTPPSTNRQILFLASSENYIRTLDAATGEILLERQVQNPWPMAGAYCTTVSKNMGIMGTPTIDPETDIAYFYSKSYIPNLRAADDNFSPLNGVYYFYAVDVKTLKDVEGFPIMVDGHPADNDPRKYFVGGLILQRPSLTQVGDVVYAGFGQLCDAFNFTGTVLAVDVKTRKLNSFVTQAGSSSAFTENWAVWHGGGAGGIWQAGNALASDGEDIFFLVDNGGGSDDVPSNTSSIAISGKSHIDVLTETVSRITRRNGSIELKDWFRPYDWQTDAGQDIGSGGFSILGDLFKTRRGKKIAIATSTNTKMYVHDLDDLGGYREGANGTDGVLQVIPLDGETFGGVGTYPFEGGYVYVNPGNTPLHAFRFNPSLNGSLFELAGKSSLDNVHWGGVGIPTVTSRNGEAGSGIVWVTEPKQGLLAWKAVPVNGNLVEIPLPKVEGANKFERPVFGDGRVYVVDGQQRLIALGVK